VVSGGQGGAAGAAGAVGGAAGAGGGYAGAASGAAGADGGYAGAASGAAGAAGTAGELDPVAEFEAAQAEATSRCEGLAGWGTLTWLTVAGDKYSTANEGTELIHGLPGDDDISLAWGTYCVLGGRGDDIIRVTAGALNNTSITGGEGADRFVYAINTVAQRNLYYSDFETGKDKLVFDSKSLPFDANTPILSVAEFDEGTTTPHNTPANAYTVVVVASASGAGQVWLSNHNEGVQTNYRVGYLGPTYPAYSATDFEFE
jgi:hypothetical protein